MARQSTRGPLLGGVLAAVQDQTHRVRGSGGQSSVGGRHGIQTPLDVVLLVAGRHDHRYTRDHWRR